MAVQLPEQCGGLEGSAVYVATEDAFPNKRMQQVRLILCAGCVAGSSPPGPCVRGRAARACMIQIDHIRGVHFKYVQGVEGG